MSTVGPRFSRWGLGTRARERVKPFHVSVKQVSDSLDAIDDAFKDWNDKRPGVFWYGGSAERYAEGKLTIHVHFRLCAPRRMIDHLRDLDFCDYCAIFERTTVKCSRARHPKTSRAVLKETTVDDSCGGDKEFVFVGIVQAVQERKKVKRRIRSTIRLQPLHKCLGASVDCINSRDWPNESTRFLVLRPFLVNGKLGFSSPSPVSFGKFPGDIVQSTPTIVQNLADQKRGVFLRKRLLVESAPNVTAVLGVELSGNAITTFVLEGPELFFQYIQVTTRPTNLRPGTIEGVRHG